MLKNLFLILLLAVSLLTAEAIPETVALSSNNKSDMEREPVVFNHSLHMTGNMGCLDCHHNYKQGQQIMTYEKVYKKKNLACVTCHKKGTDLRNRYHKLCKDCHRDYKKYELKTGPVECGLCHRK